MLQGLLHLKDEDARSLDGDDRQVKRQVIASGGNRWIKGRLDGRRKDSQGTRKDDGQVGGT